MGVRLEDGTDGEQTKDEGGIDQPFCLLPLIDLQFLQIQFLLFTAILA